MVTETVKAVGGVVSKVNVGLTKASRFIYTHVKMASRWIGKTIVTLGKWLSQGMKCLIPTPETATIMQIVAMMQQIIQSASVIAMPFKVDIQMMMEKMLGSLGLLTHFPGKELEKVEKMFPDGLLDDLKTAAGTNVGTDAIWKQIAGVRGTLEEFLRNSDVPMPRHIRTILQDILGADSDKILKNVKAEGKTNAPDQKGMDKKEDNSDLKKDLIKHKMSGGDGEAGADSMKKQLETQLSGCREQMEGIDSIITGKEVICNKLPGKNQKACEARLLARVSNIKKQLRKQCSALRDIYAQHFGESDEVAEFSS